MTAPVTLPGDFPGLREEALRMEKELISTGARGPSGHLLPDVGLVHICARLLADLSRPASRDFWARWLAERLGLDVGWTAPTFAFAPANHTWYTQAAWELRHVFRGTCRLVWRFLPYTLAEPVAGEFTGVASLATLLDHEKGPEALRDICLHVAGRSNA